jgi:hypothetical protein
MSYLVLSSLGELLCGMFDGQLKEPGKRGRRRYWH